MDFTFEDTLEDLREISESECYGESIVEMAKIARHYLWLLGALIEQEDV